LYLLYLAPSTLFQPKTGKGGSYILVLKPQWALQ
jgi:hypothetical protein